MRERQIKIDTFAAGKGAMNRVPTCNRLLGRHQQNFVGPIRYSGGANIFNVVINGIYSLHVGKYYPRAE